MQAVCRSLEQILSRTLAFLDATTFSRIYGGRMDKPAQPDQRAWRVDAQLAELVETVWAAEKMWRLQDRIEASIRTAFATTSTATTSEWRKRSLRISTELFRPGFRGHSPYRISRTECLRVLTGASFTMHWGPVPVSPHGSLK